MILLVGNHVAACRDFRISLAKTGLLTVACPAGDVMQMLEAYHPFAVVFLEPERHRVMKSLATYLHCKHPQVLRVALYEDQVTRRMCEDEGALLHGAFARTVRSACLRDSLLKMLWEMHHVDRTDMIYGMLRLSIRGHVTNYRTKYIPVRLPTYAVLRYLMLRAPESVPTSELMSVCLAPLGVRHRAAVSQIARRYNALAQSQRVGNDQAGPVMLLPRKGYFLDDW